MPGQGLVLRVIELQRHRQLQLAPRAQSLLSDQATRSAALTSACACPSGQKDFIPLRPSFSVTRSRGIQFPRGQSSRRSPEIGDTCWIAHP